jgi:hypothetical protein
MGAKICASLRTSPVGDYNHFLSAERHGVRKRVADALERRRDADPPLSHATSVQATDGSAGRAEPRQDARDVGI